MRILWLTVKRKKKTYRQLFPHDLRRFTLQFAKVVDLLSNSGQKRTDLQDLQGNNLIEQSIKSLIKGYLTMTW